MPGVKACGRCGASLQLGAVAISVCPPRASAWAKWWRRRFWWSRVNWRHISETIDDLLLGRGVRQYPTWQVMVRMVVPGWPYFYRGNRIRGWAFLGTFLGLAPLALGTLGTVLGSIFLGLAVAVHASSVLDVVIAETRQSRARLTYAVICLAGVGLAVYWPLGYLAGAWTVPRQITADLPPFARGDVVLFSPGLYALRAPQPGDVVLYEVPSARVAGRYAGRAANYAIQGQRIDRVVAGPGEHVSIQGGKLLVDGKPSSYLPLDVARMPGALDVQVPAGFYAILPTTALREGMSLQGLDWQRVSLVPAHQILGRVYLRHWPWYRLSLF
ncbi:MAG: hypothetical protein B7Z73_02470 [Planctomycetia bacterium 21-64-5]|nr:MAG: hypothetical protein B7Z73_02470 [Planctomycetia bacterium 21-64-5]HQU41644.1 S26 family signal peptidase [Pirellulales bacterium]